MIKNIWREADFFFKLLCSQKVHTYSMQPRLAHDSTAKRHVRRKKTWIDLKLVCMRRVFLRCGMWLREQIEACPGLFGRRLERLLLRCVERTGLKHNVATLFIAVVIFILLLLFFLW